jgi:hypothetical protein
MKTLADLPFENQVMLAVFSFLLTTLLGSVVGYFWSTRTWNRQTRIDLHRQRYAEGTKFLDDLSQLVGRRHYLLQRLFWAIKDGDQETIAEREKKYFEAVEEWNSKYWLNRNKIPLLVGDEQARLFLNYDDDSRQDNPTSLHYTFVRAHRLTLVPKASPETTNDNTASVIQELNFRCSSYLENLTTDFLRRAASLALLEVPASGETDAQGTSTETY